MSKWWAVVLIAAVLPGQGRAQENEQVHALARRVKLEPERRDFANPLAEFDEAATLRLAAQILLPAPPLSTSGFQIFASSILDRLASDGYDNALAEYRRLLREGEPSLALRPFREFRSSDGLTSRDSQALAHEWLARLPPSILDRYQASIEADASRLLAEGTLARDQAPLRRLVRDHRASVQANKALALLGDLAFERGDFEEALDWWRRLAPLPSRELVNRQSGNSKAFREGVDLIRIHAKQALAYIFASRPEAAREVGAFHVLYPDDRGKLAGRDDAYHSILTHWLNESSPSSEHSALDLWPTFAGAPTRNRILGKAPSDRLWLDGATWRVPLPKLDSKPPTPAWLSAARSLAISPTPFHPVIADGQVLISDGETVYSHDILTGTLRFRASSAAPFDLGDDSKVSNDLAFSVSAAAGRVFARLGNRPGDARPRRLVAIDTAVLGPARNRILWTVDADAADAPGRDAYFETDPLVIGERIYLGIVRKGDLGPARFLACFDFAGTNLWQSKLADFTEIENQRPARQSLLAGTSSTIVWATHAGVVLAVDAWTGRRLWAFRYPGIDAGPSPRGAASCLIADGRVYLAPVDSLNLYCLDAESGFSLWERTWTKGPTDIVAGPAAVSDVVDLLGVVEDRLIFTDRGRLQALDARTGSALVWQQPSMGRLPGQGRGLLAGPWVFWPTADPEVSWRVLTNGNGSLRHPDVRPEYYELTTLRGLPAGNIVFGSGCLVVAGAKEMVVYVPAGQQLPLLERDPQALSQPAKLFRLALAQIEKGRGGDAQATLTKLEQQVPAADLGPWTNLIRERIEPQPPLKRPASAAIEKKRAVEALPSNSASPQKVIVTKLTAAWGPIPGVAPPVERSQSTMRDDVTVVLDGPEIAFIESRTGEELFRRKHGVAPVDWLGRHDSTLLVASRDGVEAWDLESRRATWRFDAPDLAGARWRLIDDNPRQVIGKHRLVGFELTRRSLTLFEDRGRGFALDPKTGAVLSVQGGDLIEPLADSHELQPAIEWNSGLPKRTWSSEPGPMAFQEARRRMVRLDNGAMLLGEPFGVVRIVQAGDSNHSSGLYLSPWTTSLTGGSAYVLGDDSLCLALIPRNQGSELIRFERPSLSPVWTVPAHELRDGFDVRAATWDDRALYLVHAGELQARDLANGSLLWKRALPAASGPWKVERFGGELVVWPQSHAGLPAIPGSIDPIAAALTLAFGRRGIGAVPILFVEAKSGAVKQQLDVPHDAGPVFVNVQETRLVVSAGGMVRAWSAAP